MLQTDLTAKDAENLVPLTDCYRYVTGVESSYDVALHHHKRAADKLDALP